MLIIGILQRLCMLGATVLDTIFFSKPKLKSIFYHAKLNGIKYCCTNSDMNNKQVFFGQNWQPQPFYIEKPFHYLNVSSASTLCVRRK